MVDKTVLTISSQETYQLGEKIVQTVSPGTVLCLYGDLGSGKTTFTQGFAKRLGIDKKIISPTFVIIRRYEIQLKTQNSKLKNFYHIDLYRIKTDRDMQTLGLDEILTDKNAVVVIEWAEKLGSLLPKKRIDVHFEYIDENKRKISIKQLTK